MRSAAIALAVLLLAAWLAAILVLLARIWWLGLLTYCGAQDYEEAVTQCRSSPKE